MSWKNLLPSKKMLALMLAPGMVFVSSLSMQQSALSLSFETPGSDVGQPGSSIGGGVRGTACIPNNEEVPDEKEEIVGLMPTQNIGAVGRTVSKTPTLFWYVPENYAEMGEITIVDEAGEEVYLAEFALPSKSGIIKYEIPESVELEQGKKYQWNMSLVCDPDDRAVDEFARGHMLVVEESENLEEDLAKATNALEKATAYANEQVWHDTLSSLAEVAKDYPEEWTELLESVGLGAIATVDVLDCCTIEN